MRKPRRNSNLPEEPLCTHRDTDIFAQDLDRNFSLMLALLSEMNDGHASASKHTLDLVSVAQGVECVGHGCGWSFISRSKKKPDL
jgi:hypothetical protein